MKIFWLIACLFANTVLADAAQDWSEGLFALSQGKQEEALALISKAAEQGHNDAKTALRLMTPHSNKAEPSSKPTKSRYKLLLTPEPP